MTFWYCQINDILILSNKELDALVFDLDIGFCPEGWLRWAHPPPCMTWGMEDWGQTEDREIAEAMQWGVWMGSGGRGNGGAFLLLHYPSPFLVLSHVFDWFTKLTNIFLATSSTEFRTSVASRRASLLNASFLTIWIWIFLTIWIWIWRWFSLIKVLHS